MGLCPRSPRVSGEPAAEAAGVVSEEGEQHTGHGGARQGAFGESAADESGRPGAGEQRQGSADASDKGGAGGHSAAEGERLHLKSPSL